MLNLKRKIKERSPITTDAQAGRAKKLEEKQVPRVTQGISNSPLIEVLIETWRNRQDLVKADTSLTLQIKSKCRRLVGGDKAEAAILYKAMTSKESHPKKESAILVSLPFIEARKRIEEDRNNFEKQLVKYAKQLNCEPFIERIRGFGHLALSAIIGETGDLLNYENPAKVWKRLGLAVMPDGTRQRKVAGAAALEHGFCPRRRATSWTVASSLFRQQSMVEGDYRKLYDERKIYEQENDKENKSKKHIHNRCMRYIEKRFIKDLWEFWHNERKA